MIVFDLMVFKFESHVPSTLFCKLEQKNTAIYLKGYKNKTLLIQPEQIS